MHPFRSRVERGSSAIVREEDEYYKALMEFSLKGIMYAKKNEPTQMLGTVQIEMHPHFSYANLISFHSLAYIDYLRQLL